MSSSLNSNGDNFGRSDNALSALVATTIAMTGPEPLTDAIYKRASLQAQKLLASIPSHE